MGLFDTLLKVRIPQNLYNETDLTFCRRSCKRWETHLVNLKRWVYNFYGRGQISMRIDDHDDQWSLWRMIIIIVSSYSSVSMTLWALRRGRTVRRMSSGSRCVGWAFGLAFAIRTMRSRMVMMMRTILFLFFKDLSLFRAQAFDITRPKPAYGRQGLDWIAGPEYSFMVFSMWKNQPGTMKNHENRPGTMKTDQEP